ncbi:MAG: PAS domain S-box protein [Bacteroidia bacterium]|nr:PAS domain S-box protein [Bacteroidia bacterium]
MNPDEQASRLQAIIETAIDGIITIDELGLVDTINPAAARLFGYDPAEVLGKNVSMLMPEPDRARHDQYLGNYLTTGEAKIIGVGREVTGQKKNGIKFPFRLAISEVNVMNEKRIFTGIIHDLTAQKQAEETLIRYAKELERSNRELEEFAYVSSHDLQEPLRKIQAFGSRIEEKDHDNLSEKGKDYLKRMLSASARMQRLINDLLSFSRVSSRSNPVEAINLNSIVQDVLSDLEILIQESKCLIDVGELAVIEADPTQMRQLFQNLISNAIKFRSEENPWVQLYAEAVPNTEEGEPEKVAIYVKDNGIGFDEKYIDRIFQIFQRLDGQKFEGSGIGLAVCRRIANKHGGDIIASSSPGVGSTFQVILQTRQSSR